MTDLIARGDGTFAFLTEAGRLFDLIHADGGRKRWVEVAVPFTPTKLALRLDGMMFAVDDAGHIWQRLDRREPEGGQLKIIVEWRQIARAPA